MKIGGKTALEHFRLLAPVFALLLAIWFLRMVCAMASCPGWLIRVFSLTGAVPLSILLATALMHRKRFGGYSNVAWAAFLLSLWGQLLVVAAIAFSVLTGFENVYTVAEFSLPMEDPLHLYHVAGHLAMVPLGTLMGAAMGCFLLWLLRTILPNRPG